ncbi:hypothetical protein [Hoeflea poritis]|uniref:Uncharacterized protein n=1 Tax=Hoeflea poritis TaxID=2993659 RepID=A0ABT4VPG4_9HYPH|nr:hypothetical protein [Hoeflea poritis]MDA4846519.1 hypothetical protein [Hoeflea poritis]
MMTAKLPKLVRFVLRNSLVGICIGWALAAGVVYFDINGFGSLVLESRHVATALFIMFFSFGVTFGFAYLTTAVLLLPTDKDEFDKV